MEYEHQKHDYIGFANNRTCSQLYYVQWMTGGLADAAFYGAVLTLAEVSQQALCSRPWFSL